MIVRDEAEVLERCWASVDAIVDTWVVCDTGSSDGTPELVEQLGAGNPGTMRHHEWVDFGHNRSLLMEAAHGAADLLLLLDADMTLEVLDPALSLDPLVDVWLVRHAGSLSYATPRLVRGDRLWRFVGATHEHLAGDGPQVQQELGAVRIVHHADGGSRADKFERDRRLLTGAVAVDPDDARSWFYLGQTLADLGDPTGAVEAYRRRVALGGWDEEVFYAQFRIGALLASDDPDRAATELLAAWELRPTRPEPLHALARLHRDQGHHRAARQFAEVGIRIAPSADVLFVHRDIVDWGLRFERSIAAYWTGDVEEALVDAEAVLAFPELPDDVRAHAEANRQHCLDRLADSRRPARPALARLEQVVRGTRLGRIEVPIEPAWPVCNPSIAADPSGGFRAVVRVVSYRHDEGRYHSVDADGRIRTRNVLVELDDALRERSTRLVDEPGPVVPPPVPGALVVGYEDCRLVRVGDRWFALATVRDRDDDHRCRMALLHLDGPTVTRSVLLDGPDPSRHEKNWMPVVLDGELHVVYSCGPTVVLRVDVECGRTTEVARHATHPLLGPWSGGSGLVALDGDLDGHEGFVAVVHDRVVPDGGSRIYRHRFVRFDEALRIAAATPWFSFEGVDVEFAAGLAPYGDDLLVTYGVNDELAAVAMVPRSSLRWAWEPVPPVSGGAS